MKLTVFLEEFSNVPLIYWYIPDSANVFQSVYFAPLSPLPHCLGLFRDFSFDFLLPENRDSIVRKIIIYFRRNVRLAVPSQPSES